MKPEKMEPREITTPPLRLIIAILVHMSVYEGFGELHHYPRLVSNPPGKYNFFPEKIFRDELFPRDAEDTGNEREPKHGDGIS